MHDGKAGGSENAVASMILSKHEQEQRQQKLLRAAYEQQEEFATRKQEYEQRRAEEMEAKRKKEERKNKNTKFFQRIFDVKHHFGVIISPLPPAARYSLMKQVDFLKSVFTLFLGTTTRSPLTTMPPLSLARARAHTDTSVSLTPARWWSTRIRNCSCRCISLAHRRRWRSERTSCAVRQQEWQ